MAKTLQVSKTNKNAGGSVLENQLHDHPEHNDTDVIQFGPSVTIENSEEHSLLVDDALKNELKNIPDKMAFKIGEVADLLGVKAYVLRYWETEFEALRPKKSNQNQRMYTRKDVETALLVRKLLHRDRFSIEGARKALRNLKTQVKKEKTVDRINEHIFQMGDDLRSLLGQIEEIKAHLL